MLGIGVGERTDWSTVRFRDRTLGVACAGWWAGKALVLLEACLARALGVVNSDANDFLYTSSTESKASAPPLVSEA